MIDSRSDTSLHEGKETRGRSLSKTASLNWGRTTYILAIGLHIALVIIHLIFVVIHFPDKHENRISVARGTRSNTVSIVIIIAFNALEVFFTYGSTQVYLATLVYLMQKLSLRKNLNIRQTLTALHDKHAAWSGLGAAFATLYYQTHLRTGFSGLFFVVLYVFGAAALHVTTPALIDKYSSRPNFFNAIISPTVFSNSISILPTLPLMQNANATTGLYGNIIYDTPASIYQMEHDGSSNVRSLAKEFQVPNATLFNVTCRNLAGVEQVGAGNATSWFLKTSVRDVVDGNYNPLWVFNPYAIRFIPQEYFTADSDFAVRSDFNTPSGTGLTELIQSQTLLLVASVNITDSEGNNGSTFAVNPPFDPLPLSNWTDVGDHPRSLDPIVLACSLVSSRKNVNIDPIWKTIARDSIAADPRKTSRTWSSSEDPLVQSWASIFLESSPSPIIATRCVDPRQYPGREPQCQMKDYLTVVENEASSQRFNNSVNLHDLENILEDLTAAVFWGAANFPSKTLDFTSGREFTGMVVDVAVYDPNVLLLMLLVGLLCSVALLCIAVHLLRGPQDAHLPAGLNTVGLLQFIWLLGKGSDVQTKIAAVTVPSTDNLRAAGMNEITLSRLVLRDASKRRSDEES
ncbi:hypothetical protein B0H12DRAFT_1014061 [Mycena haematopus]|nr:hypothetical protein B0H12DRAFT_1014061 [Mycena haematopus]